MKVLYTGLATALFALLPMATFAYSDYSGCSNCHGNFTDDVSTKGTIFPGGDKHAMHRSSSNMDSDCGLCHVTNGDTPQMDSSRGTANSPGYGCVGCHGREQDAGHDDLSGGRGAGLRQHHQLNGVNCAACHSDANPANYHPVGENVLPAYFGTAIDTRADDACNLVAAAQTGENWSVGDFAGLDNDGDNRYDREDSDCVPPMVSLADTSGNSVAELAVLRPGAVNNDDGFVVEIRDSATGVLLKYLSFLSDDWTAISMRALGDSDGNGRPEIAVLANWKLDGRAVVQIQNASGSALPRTLWFSAGNSPKAMEIIEEAAYNGGVPRVAVLSTRDSDGRGVVEIKDVTGATNGNLVWVAPGLQPIGMALVGDADRNGVPEVAVLSRRSSDGRIVVEVKNVSGATNAHTIWFESAYSPVAIAAVGDADVDGVEEVVVLMTRNSDGRIVAQVKNARGAANANSVWFEAGDRSLSLLSLTDADANTVPELGMLSTRISDGQIRVEVKNAIGDTNPFDLWYSTGFTARSIVETPDADTNGVAEAAVLLVRDADERMTVQLRNLRGAPQTRYIWLTAP